MRRSRTNRVGDGGARRWGINERGKRRCKVASALGELTFLCRLLLRINIRWTGWKKPQMPPLLTWPLVSATPDGVHTVACRRMGDASAWLTPDTSYDKDQVQLDGMPLSCACSCSLDSIDHVSPVSYLQNKTSWRSKSC